MFLRAQSAARLPQMIAGRFRKRQRESGMHIILGGTGHVGSALAEALLVRGEAVTIVTRDADKAQQWRGKGAATAVIDMRDVDALRQVFRGGRRLFLLNPPAAPSTDTDREEKNSLSVILTALEGSGIEKVVAESTYGAQPVERCGDLGILYDMERALAAQPIPASIIRAAYYMSNWDAALATAKSAGVVQTMYPADFLLPMVAPRDLGRVACRLLTEPAESTGLHHVEGPRKYSADNVAAAFSTVLQQPVRVVVIPREQWVEAFEALGFSNAAAQSYARMTAVTLDEDYQLPDMPVRGEITLQEYVAGLVRGSEVG